MRLEECLRAGKERRAKAIFGDVVLSKRANFRLLWLVYDMTGKVVQVELFSCHPPLAAHSPRHPKRRQLCLKKYSLKSLRFVSALMFTCDLTDRAGIGARIHLCG